MARIQYFLISILILCLLALFVVGQLQPVNGLNRVFYGDAGYERAMNWLWPAVDGADFERLDGLNGVNQVTFSGYVWQGKNGEATWRIVHNGGITVKVNDAVIFEEADTVPRRSDDITIPSDTDVLRLEIDYRHAITDPAVITVDGPRLGMGIYERDAFGGWQLLPSYRLYPEIPERSVAQNSTRLAVFNLGLLVITALTIIALIIRLLWQFRPLRNRTFLMGLFFVVLALIPRLIVMADRSASDPLFYYLTPGGDDNYVVMGRQWLSGEYELAGTFWPPGPILWFAGITALLGPQLWKAYLLNILISALAGAAVFDSARRMAGQRVGLIAGLIYALYPPLIFYQATTQSVVLDAFLMIGAIWFGLLALQKSSLRWAALMGVFIGLAGLSRGTGLLIGLAFFLALFGYQSVGRGLSRKGLVYQALTIPTTHPFGLRLTVIAAIFAVLILLPQWILNSNAGEGFSVVPYSNGGLTLYSGNNRDADGVWAGRGAAFTITRLAEEDYVANTLADFREAPLRVLELNLRKLALFFNNDELVSNVEYETQGLAHSDLLRWLSLGGGVGNLALSVLVWIGIVELAIGKPDNRRGLALPNPARMERRFILWTLGLLILSTVLFVIAGRLRVPTLPLMVIAAAAGVDLLLHSITQRRMTRKLLIALVISGMLLAAFRWIEDHLPRKSYVNALPVEIIQRDADFDGRLRLIGFEPIKTDYMTAGYLYIILYWQAMTDLEQPYRVFVELADENGRVTGIDQLLGVVSYPPMTTEAWPEGAVVREGYLLQLPDEARTILDLNVGVYSDETGEALTVTQMDGEATSLPFARLMAMGITDRPIPDTIEETPLYNFKESLWLIDYDIPQQIASGGPVVVRLDWLATEKINEDFIIFVHVYDQEGELVAQSDSPQVDSERTTSALIPGVPVTSLREITLPDEISGPLVIMLGVYRYPSIENLPVADSDGNPVNSGVVILGSVRILP